jgi:D-3-phosphoglycerate dehydrogenase
MLGQISEALGEANINIRDMVNMSRGDIAYTLVDLDSAVPESVRARIGSIKGVLMTRVVPPPRGA